MLHIHMYILHNYTRIYLQYVQDRLMQEFHNSIFEHQKKNSALAFASGQSSASNWQVCDTKTEMEDIKLSTWDP